MTSEQYDKLVLQVRLESLARSEGGLLAQADEREARVERLQKMIDGEVPSGIRKKVGEEIAQLLDEARAIRDEAAGVHEHALRLTKPADPPKPAASQPGIEDVIYTLEENAAKGTPVESDFNFILAIERLRSEDVREWRRARIALQTIAWPAPGDAFAQAALAALDRLIAEK